MADSTSVQSPVEDKQYIIDTYVKLLEVKNAEIEAYQNNNEDLKEELEIYRRECFAICHSMAMNAEKIEALHNEIKYDEDAIRKLYIENVSYRMMINVLAGKSNDECSDPLIEFNNWKANKTETLSNRYFKTQRKKDEMIEESIRKMEKIMRKHKK